MVANLKSILGDEVILPCDLLPDDDPVDEEEEEEDDFDQNLDDFNESSNIDCYSGLALEYYNCRHDTDYKFFTATWLERTYVDKLDLIHFGFAAAPSTAVDCNRAAKQFCSKLQAGMCDGDEKVISCCMVDGLKTTSCELCYRSSLCDYSNKGWDEAAKLSKSKKEVPPLSHYSHYLADGVTLSDKAKSRAPFILFALTYYNKKQRTDYKLVEALPYCLSYMNRYAVVYHCNFIARKNVSAKSDAPNKLFFAELMNHKGNWVVTACRVLRGKTAAGCHYCPQHLGGKRVIHPIHGFRFGLYPERRSVRRCR